MDLWGKITAIKGNQVVITLENREELANLSLFTTAEQPQVIVDVQDERHLSKLQRKKAYAIIAEIAKWSGMIPEECKEWMKYYFTAETGNPYFSFSDTDMTTARRFGYVHVYVTETSVMRNLWQRCADTSYRHCWNG